MIPTTTLQDFTALAAELLKGDPRAKEQAVNVYVESAARLAYALDGENEEHLRHAVGMVIFGLCGVAAVYDLDLDGIAQQVLEESRLNREALGL